MSWNCIKVTVLPVLWLATAGVALIDSAAILVTNSVGKKWFFIDYPLQLLEPVSFTVKPDSSIIYRLRPTVRPNLTAPPNGL
jgi:hypothetical protein